MLIRVLDAATTRMVRYFGLGYDTSALLMLRDLTDGYVPWSQSAIRPSALACILNDITINQRRTIVELGAGMSTALIARLISAQPGKTLISFEHDPAWCDFLNDWLEQKGLDRIARVIEAPLAPCPGFAGEWYDVEVIRAALQGIGIDCLICDGPPAYTQDRALARLPAVPMMGHALAERCAVFLDDAQRHGERRVARTWQRTLGTRFRIYLLRGGFAVGVRGEHKHFIL
jgi:Methyltransferase domain